MGFLIPPHPLKRTLKHKSIVRMNQDLMKLFQEIICLKDRTYVINLHKYAHVSTHWIALFCNRSEIVYLDSFGVEHVPEEMK